MSQQWDGPPVRRPAVLETAGHHVTAWLVALLFLLSGVLAATL